MSRRIKILFGLGLVMVIALATLLFTAARPSNQRPSVVPEPIDTHAPSPIPDPELAERNLVKQLSLELAAKYFTYSRPTDQSYLDSIRPYLDEDDYSEAARAAAKEARKNIPVSPLRSTAETADLESFSEQEATVATEITSQQDGQTFVQDIVIHWVKSGARWRADSITIRSTTKGDAAPGNGP